MSKSLAWLWLVLVLAAVAHVGAVSWHGLPLQSDIMALLPREDGDDVIQRAKDRMLGALAERAVVLVGHGERGIARAQAEALGRRLAEAGVARPGVSVPTDAAIRRLGETYFPHRAGLLAEADRERLLAGDGAALATRALSQVYGFGGPADSRLLARDPFLLFPAFLSGVPLPGSRLAVDDGMLSTRDADGTTWVMVELSLADTPFALGLQRRLAAEIAAMRAAAPPDLRLLRLGTVFFAEAGARNGISEAAAIGAVSLAGVVVLVLLVFRSATPLLLTTAAIAVGLVTALSACLLLFGSLHVAAQLFGAGLIGVAVDYALHYFGQAFTQRRDPAERLAHVRPGLVLGLATSVLGYACLGLAPFPGLRQVAVFSGIGLAGAFLTVVLWFPLLDRLPPRALNPRVAGAVSGLWRLWAEDGHRRARLWLAAALLAVAALGTWRLEVDDDWRRQQRLPPDLVAEQAEAQRLIGFGRAHQFLVVEGGSEQQVLEREEELGRALGQRTGWLAVARFVPSAKRQAENARLVETALTAPHLESYRARIGLPAAPPEPPPPRPLEPADLSAAGGLPFLDLLVVDGLTHMVALDSGMDLEAVRNAAEGVPGVRFVDPTADMNGLLKTYRHRALALLALSAALSLPLLAWRYGWGGAVMVLAPAVVALTATPAILALFGMPFSFFGAMALVLVLSIATDYAIFCAEDRRRDPATLFAVFLATATTLLSFGLLALSSLAAVRAFGATMLVGVALAFILAPSVTRRRWNIPER
ncbi:MMPL family transporter [Magnetospirillum sp. UT-4]|uniref:MMPL family transporter n=1 Tax=Magnetospirillum sp. UT-4 TaxID=2681467 RepID=UPI0013806D62|nr:hypothetical protein [Magnetospirillum sp. UT-4]CAA7626548.1 conserved membrane hypothetical protein [Magnetospirillum sp. UT-4]